MTHLHPTTAFAALTAAFSLAALPATATAAETIEISPENSKISFMIKNKPPGADDFQDVPGTFKEFGGKIVVDEADPGKSTVEIEVKTASVDTANEKRDDHLRNQDFFKVKEHPTMTFKSSSVEKNSDGQFEVTGTFTLLGESKKITIKFEPAGDEAGTTEFTIKRSDYGMDYRVPDTADEVAVKIEVGSAG